MRRLLTGAVLLLTASATASASGPHDRGAVPGLPVYLALGDSVAAGVQSAPPTGDRKSTLARWKASGYAAQLAEVLEQELDCLPAASERAVDGCRQLQYVNEARLGETTTSLLDEQLAVVTAVLRQRNADRNPRNDVEVISLTIGGNDVFTPVVEACVRAGTPSSTTCALTVTEVLTEFAGNYTRILAELRAAAGPETTILTMTYYNPLGACHLSGAAPLADVVLEGTPASGFPDVGLNDLIRTVSAQYGAVVADAYGQLEVQEDFVGGQDCLHPDASGHDELADVFASAFRAAS